MRLYARLILLHTPRLYYLPQEEERIAEQGLSLRDPDRPTSAWIHGACSLSLSPPEGKTPGDTPRNPSETSTPTPTQTDLVASAALPERQVPESVQQDAVEAAGTSCSIASRTSAEAEGIDPEKPSRGQEGVDERGVKVGEPREDRVREGGGAVPDFRLNGFVYVCPLVSEGCKFTAKAWLQDEDD